MPCVATDPPEVQVERSVVYTGQGFGAELACVVFAEPEAEVSGDPVTRRGEALTDPGYMSRKNESFEQVAAAG